MFIGQLARYSFILLSEPTYEEIVKLDESLDIATEIEHMIEVAEIVSVLTVTGTFFKGMAVEDVLKITEENTRRVFVLNA